MERIFVVIAVKWEAWFRFFLKRYVKTTYDTTVCILEDGFTFVKNLVSTCYNHKNIIKNMLF